MYSSLETVSYNLKLFQSSLNKHPAAWLRSAPPPLSITGGQQKTLVISIVTLQLCPTCRMAWQQWQMRWTWRG